MTETSFWSDIDFGRTESGAVDISEVDSIRDFIDVMLTDFPDAVMHPETGVPSIPDKLKDRGTELQESGVQKIKDNGWLNELVVPAGTTEVIIGTGLKVITETGRDGYRKATDELFSETIEVVDMYTEDSIGDVEKEVAKELFSEILDAVEKGKNKD